MGRRGGIWLGGARAALVAIVVFGSTLAGAATAGAEDPSGSDCGAPVVDGTATRVTCAYTGAAQHWTVPAGVTLVQLDVQGAQGAEGGGLGGRARTTRDVTPGEVLQVNVGGSAGFNGGGGGSVSGGGASDVRVGAFALGDRVAVAGGGGGGPGGGAGGGRVGGAGTPARAGFAIADGGNQTGSTGSVVLGQGGAGEPGAHAPGTLDQTLPAGYGGGGGFYGGTGGHASGFRGLGEIVDIWPPGAGGGGSGYTPDGAGLTSGYRSGDGVVVISWPAPGASTTALSTSRTPEAVGAPITFTARVTTSGGPGSAAGAVRFGVGDAPFADPVPLDATGTATVTTSTLGVGTHEVWADFIPADEQVAASTGTLAQEVAATCHAPVASVGRWDVTCPFVGMPVGWTVPEGVTSATFDVRGAQGQSYLPEDAETSSVLGGRGGRSLVTRPMTAGETVRITVGGQDGFNGGGLGGETCNHVVSPPICARAYSGGGASDVRVAPFALGDRIVVAGGGGGAGAAGTGGGAGGGAVGGEAEPVDELPGSNTLGGNQDGSTGSGLAGQGGAGASGVFFVAPGGAGGGGGHFGGAGGARLAGGGGGSGFTPDGTGMTSGVQDGDGLVTISWSAAPSTPTIANLPTDAVYGGSGFVADVDTTSDGTTSVTTATPSACSIGDDGLSVAILAAGTCTLTAHVTAGSGFAAADGTPQSFTIARAPLTVTAPPVSLAAGSAVPSVPPGYDGFRNGDGPSSLDTPATCSVAYTPTTPAGSYPGAVTCSGAVDANYVPTFVAGTLTVTGVQVRPTTVATSSISVLRSLLTGKVTFVARLSSDGTPVAGKPIAFSLGGTPACTAVTDSRGSATCALPGLRSVLALLAGGQPRASFAGDPGYSASTAVARVTI